MPLKKGTEDCERGSTGRGRGRGRGGGGGSAHALGHTKLTYGALVEPAARITHIQQALGHPQQSALTMFNWIGPRIEVAVAHSVVVTPLSEARLTATRRMNELLVWLVRSRRNSSSAAPGEEPFDDSIYWDCARSTDTGHT